MTSSTPHQSRRQPKSPALRSLRRRAPSRARSSTPAIDLLLVGGLSLIVFVPLLLSGRTDLVLVGAGAQAWIGTAINMPHFMASYRLVYRDRETIMKHKWASIYVPLILVAYIVFAVLEIQYFLPQGCTEAIRANVTDPACRPLAHDAPHRHRQRISRLALHRAGVGHDGVLRLPRRRALREVGAAAHPHGSSHPPGVARLLVRLHAAGQAIPRRRAPRLHRRQRRHRFGVPARRDRAVAECGAARACCPPRARSSPGSRCSSGTR